VGFATGVVAGTLYQSSMADAFSHFLLYVSRNSG
jgi:cytochrome bd-type quinol oxidase subunit 1